MLGSISVYRQYSIDDAGHGTWHKPGTGSLGLFQRTCSEMTPRIFVTARWAQKGRIESVVTR